MTERMTAEELERLRRVVEEIASVDGNASYLAKVEDMTRLLDEIDAQREEIARARHDLIDLANLVIGGERGKAMVRAFEIRDAYSSDGEAVRG